MSAIAHQAHASLKSISTRSAFLRGEASQERRAFQHRRRPMSRRRSHRRERNMPNERRQRSDRRFRRSIAARTHPCEKRSLRQGRTLQPGVVRSALRSSVCVSTHHCPRREPLRWLSVVNRADQSRFSVVSPCARAKSYGSPPASKRLLPNSQLQLQALHPADIRWPVPS